MLRLRVDRNKCTNCRFCESACVFTHRLQTVLKNSCIQVTQRAVEDQSYAITVCHQCSLCPPLDVCPTGALTRDPQTGIVYLDNAKCPPGCRLCVDACPLDAIWDGTDGLILCDFCGGDPECVKVCYTEALFVREYTLTPRGLRKHRAPHPGPLPLTGAREDYKFPLSLAEGEGEGEGEGVEVVSAS